MARGWGLIMAAEATILFAVGGRPSIPAEGCGVLDDAAVAAFGCVGQDARVFVRSAFPDGGATLASCDSGNGGGQIRLSAPDLDGRWNRLLFRTRETNVSDAAANLTVITAGTMLEILTTSEGGSFLLKVADSSGMLWALGCDPREEPDDGEASGRTESTTTTAQAEGSSTTATAQAEGSSTTSAAVQAESTTGAAAYDASACRDAAIPFMAVSFVVLSFAVGIFVRWRLGARARASELASRFAMAYRARESGSESGSVRLRTRRRASALDPGGIRSGFASDEEDPATSKPDRDGLAKTRNFLEDEDGGFPARCYPLSPPPPPPPIDGSRDSMFLKAGQPLGPSSKSEAEEEEDEEEHDYDYMDIAMFKRQLDKDREEQEGEEERKRERPEDMAEATEGRRSKAAPFDGSLRCYDSENSLYEPFDGGEGKGNLVLDGKV